jgi:hypothetical protein
VKLPAPPDPFDTPAMRAFIRHMDRVTSEMCREIRKRGPVPVDRHAPLRFQGNPWWLRRGDYDPDDPWL